MALGFRTSHFVEDESCSSTLDVVKFIDQIFGEWVPYGGAVLKVSTSIRVEGFGFDVSSEEAQATICGISDFGSNAGRLSAPISNGSQI